LAPTSHVDVYLRCGPARCCGAHARPVHLLLAIGLPIAATCMALVLESYQKTRFIVSFKPESRR